MFVVPNPNSPMFFTLCRRKPRTKSVFDRVSSRRHSSVDSSRSYDNQQESVRISNNNQDICTNHLGLTDSTLQLYNNVIMSSNGQDDSTVSFNGDIDDDDSDEYAYFISYCRFFFFPSFLLSAFSLYNISSFLFCLDASSLSCSSFIDFYLSGEKHE